MPDAYRIAIVGSGPAGLSAAGRAAELGIAHVLLEQTARLADTICRYQHGKHVMATPSPLALRSDIAFAAGTREAILDSWNEQAVRRGINVRYHAEVRAITGGKGAFTIALADGGTIAAETVILAIGTQGNPDLLRIAGIETGRVQYQLDDPRAYRDEHIAVIGAGDAGIEHALGLAADPGQRNIVTILDRSADFSGAKDANVKALFAARDAGRVNVMPDTAPIGIEPGFLTLDTRDGEARIPCDRIIARIGSAPPRAFVEACGVAFSGADRESFPKLSASFESTTPGLYVIGALAGTPLIKHAMNQGHDVVEFINGNTALKPADEPILAAKFGHLPGRRTVAEWLELLRSGIAILNDLSPLQMRAFMLDADVLALRKGEPLFERHAPGSSLFGIASGTVRVQIDPRDPARAVPIAAGSVVGEAGLIAGRRRGATVRAGEDALLLEIPRNAALKLIGTVPAARRILTEISIERQLLQIFGSGLTPQDVRPLVESAEIEPVGAGDAIIMEGDEGLDIYVIHAGSMVVEKEIAGKPVFLSYLPAGSHVGEMALIEGGRRTATVRAATRSEVIRVDGEAFRALLARKPGLLEKARRDATARAGLNSFVEARKDGFAGVVDMYSSVAGFLVDNGIGDAADVLLIDEHLCTGCDNCEKACADSHEGLSRLDREAGRSYAHLNVPTSCRHCEHPHCMADCPPNAIHRGPDGEAFIDETCIGCGNCQRNCPYGVIRMDKVPPRKPGLLSWLFLGRGPGPGEPDAAWSSSHARPGVETPRKAIKCDMCAGIDGGPACVRACPTGAAISVSPEAFLAVAELDRAGG